MEIIDIKILRGPNYWSNYRKKLIVIKLDLKKYEDLPTNLLPNFTNRLVALIPSLYNHYCSKKIPGGFIQRMNEGTWLGHVVEHVALELQTLAGMSAGFGRTRSSSKAGIYHVVFAYEYESAGVLAGKLAV